MSVLDEIVLHAILMQGKVYNEKQKKWSKVIWNKYNYLNLDESLLFIKKN